MKSDVGRTADTSARAAQYGSRSFRIDRPVTRYGLALVITILALLLRGLLNPVLGDLGPFLSVYAAVTLCAVYLGAGPATLTAVLGLLGGTHFFLARDQFSFETRYDVAYASGYLIVAATIIVLAAVSRRALAQLEAARLTLEQKVEERTRQLQAALSNLRDEMNVRATAEETRRKLAARMMNIQDEERRRIARELHDSMGQTLAALKMTASPLSNIVAGRPESKRLDEVNALIDEAIRQTRTISHLLHPPMLDELGFASAASWYVSGFARRSGIELTLDLPEAPRFPDAIELTLFRVLQESLTNILRHSESKKADVRLEINKTNVILTIRDYGKGIAPERLERFAQTGSDVGVGLGGMRERVSDLGGKLELHNAGVGTIVKVTLPLEHNKQQTHQVGSSNPALTASA